MKAFYPNKWKVIGSLVSTLICDFIFLNLLSCEGVEFFCVPTEKASCQNFPVFLGVIPHCCGCYTFVDFLAEILYSFVFPFFFFYIVFSIGSLSVELIRHLKQKTS